MARTSEAPKPPLTLTSYKSEQFWSAPLPPPAALRAYEDVFDGCAERIIGMAERQSVHRQDLESKRLDGAQRAELLGQGLGFVIGMTAVGSSVWLITAGFSIAGVIALISAITGLVTVFIKGKQSQSHQLQEKLKELQAGEPESKRQLELFDGDDDRRRLGPTQH